MAACNVQLEPVQQQGSGGSGSGATCAPTLQADAEVIACGLPPHLTVAAADADAVYLVAAVDGYESYTAAVRVLRYDKASGEMSIIYDELAIVGGGGFYFGRTAGHFYNAVVADGPNLFFGGTVDPGPESTQGVKSLTKLGTGESQLVADGSAGFGMPLYQDATHLYFRGSGPITTQQPVVRLSKAGGAIEPLAPNGDVVGVHNGFVYYMDDNDDLMRVSSSGGTPEMLAQGIARLADGSWSIAVGDTHVYYAVEDEFTGTFNHEIYQVPLAGGAPSLSVSYYGPSFYGSPSPNDGMQTAYGPHHLAFVDGELTFLEKEGQVVRVAPGTLDIDSAQLTIVFSEANGRRASPAQFDGQHAYAAYQRGGLDGPLEGILVRVPYN